MTIVVTKRTKFNCVRMWVSIKLLEYKSLDTYNRVLMDLKP